MRKKKSIFSVALTVLIVFLFCAATQADQFEEALDASKRGDFAASLELFKPLAEGGHVDAQFILGLLHYGGKGVLQDYKEAGEWFRRAAEQGHADAQFYLGCLYLTGNGVTQDYKKAERWFLRAAKQGHTDAQVNLGGLYGEGKGVAQDFVVAYFWANLATAFGNEAARTNRDLLAKRMTADQLAEAQRRAQHFRPIKEGAAEKRDDGSSMRIASTGTGFIVNNTGHILTNEHVVKQCREVQVRLPGDAPIGAKILHTNTDVDLAVLKIEPSAKKQLLRWNGEIAEFRSDNSPRLGESLVVFGFPLAGELSSEGNVTTGNITALAGPGDDDRLYQISAPIQPGNSGGPVFDESGRVIGVVVAKLDALKTAAATGDIPQNVNFALKGGIATSFLGLYRIPFTKSTKNKQKRFTAADVAENAQKVTMRVECLQ